MNLMTDEKVLMNGDYKQVNLTTHRIRQEIKSWGQVGLTSIMLEEVTSCEFSKKSRPLFLIIGLLLVGITLYSGSPVGGDVQSIQSVFLLVGIILIVSYFSTIKRGLFISSPTAKIIINTDGMKYENVKLFIEKLEEAKNERFLLLKSKIV
jgi:hypothetical protein